MIYKYYIIYYIKYNMFNFIRNLIKRNTKSIQLHRWCHPEYNKKCDIERKIDLANYDNSFHVITNNNIKSVNIKRW